VTTDIDGNYTIQVPNVKTASLTFSYVGMEAQEIKLNGRTKIDVTLKPNSNALDEVVVVGYRPAEEGIHRRCHHADLRRRPRARSRRS